MQEGRRTTTFIPLSYIDDVNSIRVGCQGPMDEVLEETATSYRLVCDSAKDWKNKVHPGVDLNPRRHCKFGTDKTRAAFNEVRRLTRLPTEAKRKVLIGQLLPTLQCKAHSHTLSRWRVQGQRVRCPDGWSWGIRGPADGGCRIWRESRHWCWPAENA